MPGCKDKGATQQLASELERDAERVQSGLTDRFAEHRKRPLAEHLADWRRALTGKGGTTAHASLSANRVRSILTATKAVFIGDLSVLRPERRSADGDGAGRVFQTSTRRHAAAEGVHGFDACPLVR